MDQNAESRRLARAQKKAKAAARKKLLWRIGILAAGLALIAGMIALLSRCSQEEPAPEPVVGEDTVIHFTAGGDLNVTDKLISAGQRGSEDIFRDVAPLLADADLSALNLEGNLAGAPYGSATGSAPHSLALFKTSGVAVIQRATLRTSFSGSPCLQVSTVGLFSVAPPMSCSISSLAVITILLF